MSLEATPAVDSNATVRLNLSSIAQAVVVSLLLGATGFWGVQFNELKASVTEANKVANDQAMKTAIIIERQNESLKRFDSFDVRLTLFEQRLNSEKR